MLDINYHRFIYISLKMGNLFPEFILLMERVTVKTTLRTNVFWNECTRLCKIFESCCTACSSRWGPGGGTPRGVWCCSSWCWCSHTPGSWSRPLGPAVGSWPWPKLRVPPSYSSALLAQWCREHRKSIQNVQLKGGKLSNVIASDFSCYCFISCKSNLSDQFIWTISMFEGFVISESVPCGAKLGANVTLVARMVNMPGLYVFIQYWVVFSPVPTVQTLPKAILISVWWHFRPYLTLKCWKRWL